MAPIPRLSPWRRVVLAILLAPLVGSCIVITGNSDNNGGNGSFTIAITPETIPIARGGTRTATVTITRTGGFTGAVALSDSGPTGITSGFSPTSLTGSTLSSTLTLTAATDAPIGFTPLVIIGKADGETRIFTPLSIYSPAISVSRYGTGSGTVTSSPAGIDCGTTCSATFTATSVTLTAAPASGSAFASWTGACTGTSPTCVFTPGVGATAISATFNSTAPGISLAVASPPDSVLQGGSGSATLNITRLNGFSGAVNLAVSGAPAGMTVTPNPASASGTSASLDISVALSVPSGTYGITVTGTGTGITQQTATFNVRVTHVSGGNVNFSMNFNTCDPTGIPIWFAVQNMGGAWTSVIASGGYFTFPVSTSTNLAWVTQSGTYYNTDVRYTTGTELSGPNDVCGFVEQTGTRHLTGTVSSPGVAGQNYWALALGGLYAQHDPAEGTSFTLDGAPAGLRDLVAGRFVKSNDTNTIMQQMIVRRGVNYANNAAIPVLDFNSTESVIPTAVFDSLTNQNGDRTQVSVALATSRGLSTNYYTNPVAGFPRERYFALPSAQRQAGDFYVVSIYSAPPATPTVTRMAILIRGNPANENLTLGATPNAPTVTTLSAITPLRYHAELFSQTDYGDAVQARYDGPNRSVTVFRTAASAGGTPTKWGLDIPDLSAAGYNATWGLQSGSSVDYTTIAVGGNIAPFNGAPITGDAQIIGGIRGGTLP